MKVYTLTLDADGNTMLQGVFKSLEEAQEHAIGLDGEWGEMPRAHYENPRWAVDAKCSEDDVYASWYEIQEWELDEP